MNASPLVRLVAGAFLAGSVVTALLSASPALADKPSWAGAGKGHENKADEDRDRDDRRGRNKEERDERFENRFEDRHRVAVRDYYDEEFHGGRCPPGLAKKHNGCMPPGQAKKWNIGRPLPRDVVMYDVPPALVVQIGVPPAGYRYVRVASDILLIAVGTNMVADAIRDLGRK